MLGFEREIPDTQVFLLRLKVSEIVCNLIKNLSPNVSGSLMMSMGVNILAMMLNCSPSHVTQTVLKTNIFNVALRMNRFTSDSWIIKDTIQTTCRKLSQWLYIGGVKAFADGSLGSNNALFHEPYADEPGNTGLQVTDMESLSNMTAQYDKFGLQVSIHVIGDKANDFILDMYHSVASTNGKRDHRFRIEHAQHLAPGSATKFGELGIVASVQ